ncbi:hypothetical protein MN116_002749 [Schistosoma mekongi]|uniref:UBA domain-containing protein n=1 Tax=Schistosoma mekongi TaxID=38744 RepID=A0AAE1ZFT2_SCHME|nr:hypothetical protein MN116_002749 [Schistosoma mekongi]
MDKRSENEFDTWSYRMVSGVEFRYKVRVPITNELPTLNEISPVNFEYDFLHERQVIADCDEYLKAKESLNETLSTPTLPSQPNLLLRNSKQDTELPSKVHVPSLQSLSTADSCLPLIVETLPPAASHLVSGKILEPSIVDGGASNQQCLPKQIQCDEPKCSSSELTQMSPEFTRRTTCTYLKDFDIQSDDPFTTTELKTINELEELKKILMHDSVFGSCSPGAKQLTTKVVVGNDNESSTVISSSETHLVNSKKLSYSPFSSSEYKNGLCRFPESVNLPQENSSPCLRNNHAIDPKTKRYVEVGTPLNGFHNYFDSGNVRTKGSGSSVSHVNSTVPSCLDSSPLTVQPQAFSGLTEPDGSVSTEKNYCDFKITTTNMGNLGPNYSHLKFAESLLSWATSCGFSHSHARRLLELGVQKRVFSYENLEQNKLILLNLLHTFNSLLTTVSASQSSHKLSEQSALLIAITFPNDLSKAQQSARLVMYLEQNGFPRDVICQYIQNPDSKENEAVVKFLNNRMIRTNAPHNVSPVNLLFSTPCGMKSPEK